VAEDLLATDLTAGLEAFVPGLAQALHLTFSAGHRPGDCRLAAGVAPAAGAYHRARVGPRFFRRWKGTFHPPVQRSDQGL